MAKKDSCHFDFTKLIRKRISSKNKNNYWTSQSIGLEVYVWSYLYQGRCVTIVSI